MNKRQLKKTINSRRFCSVMIDGELFYDANVVGRKIQCWDHDHDGPYVEMSADVCEVTVTYLSGSKKRRLMRVTVGGKSADITND